MMMITADKTMRDIVLEYNGTAGILEKYRLDFCCQGMTSLEEACKQNDVDINVVLEELQATFVDEPGYGRYQRWDLGFLCEYIVNQHHSYVKEAIPQIREHLLKVIEVHGERHPELKEVGDLFFPICQELQFHMMKEEQVLFPYIAELSRSKKTGRPAAIPPFGSIDHPIDRMITEHEFAGAALDRIRLLLNDYMPPADGCTTLRLTYNELSAFEHDLHQHVFLENAILFPRAQKLENELKLP